MKQLKRIAVYKDGGSILYKDEAGLPYWENRRLVDKNTFRYGKLFHGNIGNTAKPALGKFEVIGNPSANKIYNQ